MQGLPCKRPNFRCNSLMDIYFSADVETDGPIPGPYSMLSFGIVLAGTFDGGGFRRPAEEKTFYRELRPISDQYEAEALRVNGLDRGRLQNEGALPELCMREAAQWIASLSGTAKPVLVAYPLGFDWMWVTWYFIRYLGASPFKHSQGFDIKTAYAVKAGLPISMSGRDSLPRELVPEGTHTHHALDDAREQAELFARIQELA